MPGEEKHEARDTPQEIILSQSKEESELTFCSEIKSTQCSGVKGSGGGRVERARWLLAIVLNNEKLTNFTS